MVLFLGVFLVAGYSLAAWTGFACYFSKDLSFQWRFPLAEQCLWPLALLILSPWIPESPRWREFFFFIICHFFAYIGSLKPSSRTP